MEIDGRITILVSSEGAIIELHDRDSGITFARVKMTSEQFCGAIGRLAYSECVEMHVPDLGISEIGKKLETDGFSFELPEGWGIKADTKKLLEIARAKMPAGWITNDTFQSQNSFFTKDGKRHARCMIKRWVDKV